MCHWPVHSAGHLLLRLLPGAEVHVPCKGWLRHPLAREAFLGPQPPLKGLRGARDLLVSTSLPPKTHLEEDVLGVPETALSPKGRVCLRLRILTAPLRGHH